MRACPTESVAVATQQAPVLTQVPDGVLRLAQRFVEPREVVVTVRQIGILFKRRLVRRERRRGFSQILEQHALVEKQQRVGADLCQRPPIHFIGLVRPAALVEQASPVGPGGGVVRVGVHGVPVGAERALRIAALERQGLRKPVVYRRRRGGVGGLLVLHYVQHAV